jgi:hypothetical protein
LWRGPGGQASIQSKVFFVIFASSWSHFLVYSTG